MSNVVPMVRKDVLPHAQIRADGSAWLTYDRGKTWTPCPQGSIALNPQPMSPPPIVPLTMLPFLFLLP